MNKKILKVVVPILMVICVGGLYIVKDNKEKEYNEYLEADISSEAEKKIEEVEAEEEAK